MTSLESLKNKTESKESTKFQMDYSDSDFRFKGIHNFLNDVKYVSLKEVPIDMLVRR
jgi:hypothetical protein